MQVKAMITCGVCGKYGRGTGRGLCGGCYSAATRAGTLPPLVRSSFEEKLAQARAGRTDDECWPWPGTPTYYGYGRQGQRYAHREVYLRKVGPILDEEELDHLCHTIDPVCPGGKTCPHRICVNYVRHLEPVTGLENWKRGRSLSRINQQKDVCDHGHELTADNLYIYVINGKLVRYCRTCKRRNNAASDARRRART